MKYFILSILSLTALLVVGCGPDEMAGTRARQEQNLRTALSVFDAFNRHDWTAMAELYTDPAEFKDPSFGIEVVKQTRKQIAEKYARYEGMSPDIRDSVVATYTAGEKTVIVEFVSSGTAPDGTRWTLPICTIFTIEDGQVSRDYTYYDNQ